MLKYSLRIFPPWAVMYRKNFVCACRQTVYPIQTIFNTSRAILGMNDIYKFLDI